MLGDRAIDADVARINAKLGLDQPILVQFVYLRRAVSFTGDLGNSIALKLPVLGADRRSACRSTLMLTAMAALHRAAAGRAAGLRRRAAPGSGADAIIRGAFQVGLSMPVFYLGLVLLTVFAAKLRWFPVGGYGETLRRQSLPPLPAGADAGAQPRRRPDAQSARRDHRGARRRLCRLRPRQGPAPRDHPGAPRAAQRADLDGHAVRPADRHAARRRRHHRDGVRHPRRRPADDRQHLRPRLSGDPGADARRSPCWSR